MPRKSTITLSGYNPLPGTRDDPNLYEDNDGMLLIRDGGLADVPPHALAQLTGLLRMDPGLDLLQPDKAWLSDQKTRIAKLDASLRLPANLFERLALRANRHRRFRFFPQCAELCPAHKGLDPRVIRNMTLLVGHECTLRTDRFRSYRHKVDLSDGAIIWLDRVDAVTAMWVGEKAFEKLYGYKNAESTIQTVESRCEACIMAVVGGRPQILSDLRANILARKARSDDGPDPRLLRILDEWINQFEYGVQQIIRQGCDVLVTIIGDTYQEIVAYKEKRSAERAAKGKAPKERGRGRHRRHSKQPDNSTPTPAQRSNKLAPAEARNNTPDVASIPPTPTPADENQNSGEEWDWLCDRMQGLSNEEQDDVLSNVHPAFSDFHARSAIPSALHPRQNGARSQLGGGVVEPNTETAAVGHGAPDVDRDGGSWVSVSVMTANPHSNEDGIANPKASTFQRQNAPNQGQPTSRYAMMNVDDGIQINNSIRDNDATEGGAYVPVRSNWTNYRREDNPFVNRPPPPASSFYSDHPGFPTNHKVTEVTKRPVEQNSGEASGQSYREQSYSPASRVSSSTKQNPHPGWI